MDTTKVINKVPTRLLTFGPGVDEDHRSLNCIIVVVPGNPGVIEYYRAFMNKLYEELREGGSEIAVWGISHAGHQVNGIEDSFPSLSANPELYDLEGQIEHKDCFLKKFLPQHVKLIFIGHSIGSKIILEVLKRNPELESRVPKACLLFPTIERMRLTPNGRMLWPFSGFKFLTNLISWPLSLLPTSIQGSIIRFFLRNRNAPDCVQKATFELFHRDVFQRFVTMGHSELETVFELDLVTLRKFKDILYFYFGTRDAWCPLYFVDEMKAVFPEMNHTVCENGFEHAFVISSSHEMASTLLPALRPFIDQ